MESIMQNTHECFLCGKNGSSDRLEVHHIFGGSNRQHSEQYGLKVLLCGAECHRLGSNSVHMNKSVSAIVKRLGQSKFEEIYTHDEFMSIFGRNYL